MAMTSLPITPSPRTSRHVIFMHVDGVIQVPHVKRVEVMVFVGNSKVEGFHGVPAQAVAAHGKHYLPTRMHASNISTVAANTCTDAALAPLSKGFIYKVY